MKTIAENMKGCCSTTKKNCLVRLVWALHIQCECVSECAIFFLLLRKPVIQMKPVIGRMVCFRAGFLFAEQQQMIFAHPKFIVLAMGLDWTERYTKPTYFFFLFIPFSFCCSVSYFSAIFVCQKSIFEKYLGTFLFLLSLL